jgi:hypothetical protein
MYYNYFPVVVFVIYQNMNVTELGPYGTGSLRFFAAQLKKLQQNPLFSSTVETLGGLMDYR